MTVTLGEGRWSYVDDARKRPYVHPLKAPAGATLTRDAPPDHPWHHALWFTVKYVNGENFWEEQPPYGVLRHIEPVVTDGTSVEGNLTWIRPDRATVVISEHRRLAHVPIDERSYAIDWTSTLVAESDVILDRTPYTTWGGYGGLALRGRSDWTDTRILVDGLDPRERVTGERGRWCDLSGVVEGGSAGVLLLDAQTNPRHPVPWYGSTRSAVYGDDGWSNFLNAAFLWDDALPLSAGADLTLRYRIVVHDGVWDAGRCDNAWTAWDA